MRAVDIPHSEWPEFLEAFTRQHRAWLTTVEAAAGEMSAPAREPRPLAAVTPEGDGRRVSAIEIAFAGNSHGGIVRVENPASVRLRQTDEGADDGLEIVDGDGLCTRVRFRAAAIPDMVDGVAPGEV